MNFRLYHFLSIVVLLFFACEEIEQDELDNDRVNIIAPTDSLATTILSHTFLWEPVKKADGYILQIATPSFNQIQQLILNQDVTETSYDFTLSPGKYEWRVKAYNNISETPYRTYFLSIDSSLNLGGAQVILSSPDDFFTTSNTTFTISWQGIASADEYRLEIRSPDWETGTLVINPVLTSQTSFTNTDFTYGEGDYAWSVAAENGFSKSGFSTPRHFTVDFTAPGTPTLVSPLNSATLADSVVTFQWSRPSDSGSPITDSLFIFTDVNETNLLRSHEVNATSKIDSFPTGIYYWKVRSTDAAGNQSSFSSFNSFTRQ